MGAKLIYKTLAGLMRLIIGLMSGYGIQVGSFELTHPLQLGSVAETAVQLLTTIAKNIGHLQAEL